MDTTAHTILTQLGGSKFLAMTGAKQLTDRGQALSFRLPMKTRNKANYVVISLNDLDTYDVEFRSLRGDNSAVKGYFEGIYADQLQTLFTQETGLETSLGTMGRRG